MIYRRLKQGTGNKTNIIYNIPLSNWWSNRENQSRSQSVFVKLCQLLARWLNRMVISSEILVWQQETLSYRVYSIWT